MVLEVGTSPEEVIRFANQHLEDHQKIRGLSVWPESRSSVSSIHHHINTVTESSVQIRPVPNSEVSFNRVEATS
jgi:hypothetical protein